MFHRIWLICKNFCLNHSQHSNTEHVLMCLAIVSGIIAAIFGILFIIKISRDNKISEHNKIKTNKKILNLLTKKKNKTF